MKLFGFVILQLQQTLISRSKITDSYNTKLIELIKITTGSVRRIPNNETFNKWLTLQTAVQFQAHLVPEIQPEQ